MSITLSIIESTNITIEIGPSPFPEALGGILISYSLHDGPLTFALTVPEARALIAEIIEQLTTSRAPAKTRYLLDAVGSGFSAPPLSALLDRYFSPTPRRPRRP